MDSEQKRIEELDEALGIIDSYLVGTASSTRNSYVKISYNRYGDKYSIELYGGNFRDETEIDGVETFDDTIMKLCEKLDARTETGE